MKLPQRNSLLLIFLLGLLLRFSLIFYDYSWDINNHIVWAKDLWERGFTGFYEVRSSEVFASPYPNYPPFSIVLFYIIYPIQSFIDQIAWQINLALPLFPSKLIFFIQSRTFLAALMKLPAIFADLGLAYLIYVFSQKLKLGNQITSKLVTTFIVFNPAFFYNSSLWGQIDSVPIFLALLSIYLLLYSHKHWLSSFLFTAAILIKPTALVYLPVYIFIFLKKFGLALTFRSLTINLVTFYIPFIPFLKNFNHPLLPFQIFSEKIMAAQSLPFVTNGAFNFWVLIKGFAGMRDTMPFLFGISYRIWGYITVGIFTALILKSFWRQTKSIDRVLKRSVITSLQHDTVKNVFHAFFLIAFVCFLFLTKMHERYSILPLPFLLIAALRDKKLLKWFIILSFISLLNLYHSWPVPKFGSITDLLYLPLVTFSLSFSNLIIFFYLLKYFVKIRHANNRRSSTSL